MVDNRLIVKTNIMNKIHITIKEIRSWQVGREFRIEISRRLNTVNSYEENQIKVKISIIK